MKKRINLLQHRFKEKSNEHIYQIVKKFSSIASLLLFIIFLVVSVLFVQLSQSRKKTELEKQQLLTYLLQQKELEAKIMYFKQKQTQLDNYVKNDARFIRYYKVLNTSLSYATNSPILVSVEIDKDRNTSFTVRVQDVGSAVSFLKYVESQQFLQFFNDLSLTHFNLLEPDYKRKSSSYEFAFRGQFNLLTND